MRIMLLCFVSLNLSLLNKVSIFTECLDTIIKFKVNSKQNINHESRLYDFRA